MKLRTMVEYLNKMDMGELERLSAVVQKTLQQRQGPCRSILPKELKEELAELKEKQRTQPKSVDQENSKWIRTCEGLEKLTRVSPAFSREVSDQTVYRRIKKAAEEHLLPESLCADLLPDLLHYLRQGSMKPVILAGEPGCGKTTAAKVVAEVLGLPYHLISAPGTASGHGLTGETRSYRGGDAGELVRGMLRTKARNPLFIVDEVEKVPATQNVAPLTHELLSMCDGTREIFDNFVGCTIDTFPSPLIMTCNELDQVPRPLRDRCTVIMFPEVDQVRLGRMMDDYRRNKETQYGGLVHLEPQVALALQKRLYDRGVRSIRQHQTLLDKVMGAAYLKALENEEQVFVTAEDALPAVDALTQGHRRMGF
jgi:ATP-dependent Lon protease